MCAAPQVDVIGGPGNGGHIYEPMFAALSSLPHLQLLSILMDKPAATAYAGSLPLLDSLKILRAPHLTTLDINVHLKASEVQFKPWPRALI